MGRRKLEIGKIEDSHKRSITYGKRKKGLLKKAKQLSILCDVDLIAMVISPSGNEAFCEGREDAIQRYLELPEEEKEKSRQEMKKLCERLGHSGNGSSSGSQTASFGDLQRENEELKATLAKLREEEEISKLLGWISEDADLSCLRSQNRCQEACRLLEEAIKTVDKWEKKLRADQAMHASSSEGHSSSLTSSRFQDNPTYAIMNGLGQDGPSEYDEREEVVRSTNDANEKQDGPCQDGEREVVVRSTNCFDKREIVTLNLLDQLEKTSTSMEPYMEPLTNVELEL